MPSKRPTFAEILPGLALAIVVGLLARVVHQHIPPAAAGALGEVIFAVAFGLLLGNLAPLPSVLAPGIRFSFQSVLRAAIVLLGAAFSFQQVVAIGGKAVLMIAVLMSLALIAAHLLGKLTGIPGRLATLIGVGTAVCGNSAIVAVAPVIGAKDEEVSFAVATNTLFGTAAVLLYPVIGRLLHFSDAAYGTWAGTAVNDTSQVVAAGFAFSEEAGRIATAVKLTRNALMGLVIVGAGIAYARAGAASGTARGAGSGAPSGATTGEAPRGATTLAARLKQSVPLFVLGFLAMAALNSFGVFHWLSERLHVDVGKLLKEASRAMILVALAGVGLSTRIDAMRRTGLKPFLVGLVVALTTSAASLLLIRLLGPASG
jgi:uncharacterized integral membrane protein (TIGR00698 family)